MRPRLVPVLPFVFSFVLSLATVGDRVFWQDSGFYLTAVHEFIPLYPPGFVLHLLLCKAWTILVAPLAGFTRAVHLFSAVCAAGAASFVALAARDLLKRMAPDRPADLPAILTACLTAAGYSFWHAALLSKSYALFYLTVAALLWLMIRAEKKRDYFLVAALLGLSWAAHPLGAFLIPALSVYAVARRDRIREWGWAWFAGIAAMALAGALGPSLLLPLLAGRPSLAGFGDPRSPGEFIRYVLGSRYLQQEGSFEIIGARWLSIAQFVWEEYLGAGLLFLGLGLWRAAKTRPSLLILAAVWVLPVVAFSLVYVHEAYPDLWMVTVYLALAPLVAAGISELGRLAPRAPPFVAGAGLLWMVAANGPDLNQRGYTLAEDYGRLVLKNVDPGAPVLIVTDDAISTSLYLRFVRGEMSDRRVVSAVFLVENWYQKLVREQYGLKTPAYDKALAQMPGIRDEILLTTAFANENAGPGRPVFCEREPAHQYLRPDLAAVPAGLFWKIVAREEAALDGKYWDFAVRPEDAASQARRARAYRLSADEQGQGWHRETFENRLIQPLLHARMRFGDAILMQDPARALQVYESVRAVPSPVARDPKFRFQRGVALYLSDRGREAEPDFRALLEERTSREIRTMSFYYLGEIVLRQGRRDEALGCFQRAMENGGVAESVLKHIQRRASSP